jgi:hypothetical protein
MDSNNHRATCRKNMGYCATTLSEMPILGKNPIPMTGTERGFAIVGVIQTRKLKLLNQDFRGFGRMASPSMER